MRIILVTGSRNWKNEGAILREIGKEYGASRGLLVIHGDHWAGADAMAQKACEILEVHTARVGAIWKKGRRAGPIRNWTMLALKPHKVLAFTEDLEKSRGTRDCVKAAERLGIPVEVFSE